MKNLLLFFEDQKEERENILRLIKSVVPETKGETLDYEGIKCYNFDKTDANGRIHVIITDILHADEDLSLYHKLLNENNSDANQELIKQASKKLLYIAEQWSKVKCPLLIITKISHPNMAKILENISNDNFVKELFAGEINKAIETFSKTLQTFYEWGNVSFFMKPFPDDTNKIETDDNTYDEVLKTNSSTDFKSKFNIWLSEILKEVFQIEDDNKENNTHE